MNNIKTNLVAVEFNDNGTCKKVLLVKNLTEQEYAKLLNESSVSKEHGKKKSEKLQQDLNTLFAKSNHLGLYLAKSIYDNLVDRGEIEDDQDFETLWTNHILHNQPLDLEKAPENFNQIWRKVNQYE